MKRKAAGILAGVIVVAALCLSGLPAIAETAAPQKAESAGVPLKQLTPGTVFTFKTDKGETRKVRIVKMQGVSIFQESSGNTSENVGFGVTLSRERSEIMDDSDREAVAKLFPLKVGNAISTSHGGKSGNGYNWVANDKMTVTGVEKITVPAGTFETFVIDTKMSEGNWKGHNICWYSPEIGYCVKQQWRSTRNNSDWELVSVAVP